MAQSEREMVPPKGTGRNEPCPCGSGKKFRRCHGILDHAASVPALVPAAPDALVREAIVAHQGGDFDRAERGYREALARAPTHPAATHFLGVVLYQRGQVEEALPLLQAAVAWVPQEAEFHNNLGLALAAADRNEEAIAAHRRALELRPGHAIAWSNLGLALQANNRLPEAADAFRRAIAVLPDFAQAHWNLSLALLTMGEFAEGWQQYEWRLAIPELVKEDYKSAGTRWDGVIRPGQTLLLTAEQGLGDTLQFVRFARQLAEAGMRVVVHAQSPLLRLLATAPGVGGVSEIGGALPLHDWHTPVMSVAGALAVDDASIPCVVPYLTADPARRLKIATELAMHAHALKIGIAWTGSKRHANDRRRSVALATVSPLFTIPDTVWFTLQQNDDDVDVSSAPGAHALRRITEPNDFDDIAALVAELDLVITVDTSIGHLAGALGKPVWIMLPYAPDWRWQLERADSRWYPTARLFRQPRVRDWDSVVRQVAAELAQ
jgi:Flp pilus assembly protein TadD